MVISLNTTTSRVSLLWPTSPVDSLRGGRTGCLLISDVSSPTLPNDLPRLLSLGIHIAIFSVDFLINSIQNKMETGKLNRRKDSRLGVYVSFHLLPLVSHHHLLLANNKQTECMCSTLMLLPNGTGLQRMISIKTSSAYLNFARKNKCIHQQYQHYGRLYGTTLSYWVRYRKSSNLFTEHMTPDDALKWP